MKKISQQMNVPSSLSAAIVARFARVDLDSTDQVETAGARKWRCLIVSGEGIVVRDSEGFEASIQSRIDQLGRREGAVGFVGMTVEVNHSPDSNSKVSPAT